MILLTLSLHPSWSRGGLGGPYSGVLPGRRCLLRIRRRCRRCRCCILPVCIRYLGMNRVRNRSLRYPIDITQWPWQFNSGSSVLSLVRFAAFALPFLAFCVFCVFDGRMRAVANIAFVNPPSRAIPLRVYLASAAVVGPANLRVREIVRSRGEVCFALFPGTFLSFACPS